MTIRIRSEIYARRPPVRIMCQQTGHRNFREYLAGLIFPGCHRCRGASVSRKIVATVVTVLAVLTAGLPAAVADEILYDSDVLTAGVQTSVINLTATPGQVQSVPVDLFISCKTQNHINGNVTVTLRPSGGSGSTVPAGGSLSAAPVTIVRPSSWPADSSACPSVNPVTAPARVSLQVGAPTANGTYQYKTRWTASDARRDERQPGRRGDDQRDGRPGRPVGHHSAGHLQGCQRHARARTAGTPRTSP